MTTSNGNDQTSNEDIDRMKDALDFVLKHSKDCKEDLIMTDLPEYITSLLKLNAFLWLAVDKLISIALQEKDTTIGTTTAIDPAEILRRYGSFYS